MCSSASTRRISISALEARLKQAGIPTVHFVSPSIWAWRGERIHSIKQAVSRMLVVFPFEDRNLCRMPASRSPMSAIRWPT